MARFAYAAVDGDGAEKRGHLEAATENAAAVELKENGLFPVRVTPSGADNQAASSAKPARKPKNRSGMTCRIQFGAAKIKTKALCTITRQLATLLDAGLPLVRGLRTLEKQSRDPAAKAVLQSISDRVEGGSTLSEALAGNPKSFSHLYVNMIRAGEAAGGLGDVLERLAEHMEKAQRLRSRVKAAITYPLVVVVIASTITAGLMVFVVPKFAMIFAGMLDGEPLPPLTSFVMAVSDLMVQRAYIIVGVIAAVVGGFKLLRRTRAGSYATDTMLYHTPPISALVTKASVAHFCQTLGTLMNAGVSVLQALQIVKETSSNEVVAQAVQTIHDSVKEGEGIARPMDATRVFPPMVVSMVEVGEETGALPDMLGRIATTYEEEVDNAVDALTALIEPVMIVLLAVLVGTIVIALFLPLISIITLL